MTPWFPKYQGVAHLQKAKNSPVSKVPVSRDLPVSKVPASRNLPVLWKPASRFCVCVNLKAHATVFKATLIKKSV